jgi:uncharacterized Zn finger protein (UPF0148 family)
MKAKPKDGVVVCPCCQTKIQIHEKVGNDPAQLPLMSLAPERKLSEAEARAAHPEAWECPE